MTAPTVALPPPGAPSPAPKPNINIRRFPGGPQADPFGAAGAAFNAQHPNGVTTNGFDPNQSNYSQSGFGGPSITPQRPSVSFPPMTPAGSSAPSVTGSQFTPIQPGVNDYRGQTITPQPSQRLTGAQGYTDQAAANLAGTQPLRGYVAPNTNDSYTTGAANYGAQAAGSIANPANYTAAQGAYGSAAGALGGARIGQYGGVSLPPTSSYGSVATGTYNPSADTTAARGNISTQLDALNSAPNRGDLARQQFDLIGRQSEPQYQSDLRAVGQKAAALGRIGSGVTTSDLGDVTQRREQSLANSRQQLSLDAAGQELQDRLNRLSAGQGVFGQLSGTDVTNAGVQQGLRNEARGERGFVAGQDQAAANTNLASQGLSLSADQARSSNAINSANLYRALGGDQANITNAQNQYGLARGGFLSDLGNQSFQQGSSLRNENRTDQQNASAQDLARTQLQRSLLGDFSGLEQQRFGNEAAMRGEARGERGYQDSLANQAQQDRIQQYLLEQGSQNQEFGQNSDYINQLIKLGYINDPSQLATQNAGAYDAQANGINNAIGGALGAAGQAAALRGPRDANGFPPAPNISLPPSVPNGPFDLSGLGQLPPGSYPTAPGPTWAQRTGYGGLAPAGR